MSFQSCNQTTRVGNRLARRWSKRLQRKIESGQYESCAVYPNTSRDARNAPVARGNCSIKVADVCWRMAVGPETGNGEQYRSIFFKCAVFNLRSLNLRNS